MPLSGTTRKRSLTGPTSAHSGYQVRISDGLKIIQYQPFTAPYNGTQVTVSEGNDWPPPKGSKLVDRGSPFYTKKSFVVAPRVMPYTLLKGIRVPGDNSWSYYYGGTILTPIPRLATGGPDFPPDMSSSDDSLNEKGATAISRCKPTNSVADLSTFLGEMMKEGLPSVIGSQTWKNRSRDARKNAAGEYLNVQFGLAPVLSEVTDIAHAIKNTDKILSQYERDAGRVVRRRFSFPTQQTETETLYLTNTWPFTAAQFQALRGFGTGKVYRSRSIERKIWFSGAFTYYLPSGYESRNGISRLASQADKLFGLKPGPEVLWNLAPWSWAVDWFSNTGDVISNLEDFKLHGLILRYGYVMEHTTVTDAYNFVWDTPSGSKPVVAPVILRTEVKKRLPANPFGFGVKWEGLSPFQLSIAAALGISRGR